MKTKNKFYVWSPWWNIGGMVPCSTACQKRWKREGYMEKEKGDCGLSPWEMGKM